MQLILISEFILQNISKILSSQHVVGKTLHMSYFTFCFYSKSLQSEAEFPVKVQLNPEQYVLKACGSYTWPVVTVLDDAFLCVS